jgi:hypothetical protein
MSKILISYFSATGNTRNVAKKIAGVVGGDLFEIEPVVKYNEEDLDWTNKSSRSTVEMQDKAFRPEVVSTVENISSYNAVVIGYPIWWYTAPSIINSFIEGNDLTGKNIYLFSTSWGTAPATSFKEMKEKYPDLNFVDAKRYVGVEEESEYKEWLASEIQETANKETLHLIDDWDKVFPKNDDVISKKITFMNHFGITLAADVYEPRFYSGKLSAIAVCGPYGAVKEQVSGLYAQELAKRGYLTLAFDPSFTGESGGLPRSVTSYDFNVEDFQAAVDYLVSLDNVDKLKIGIVGICGWGGIALQTACVDTRVKATVVASMYDVSRVTENGYNDTLDSEADRFKQRQILSEQRNEDFKNGKYKFSGGFVNQLTEDSPQYVKEYYEYYKTPRGYHERSVNSNDGWVIQTNTSLMNVKLLDFTNEIRSAVMIFHGENAHSCYMGKDAYNSMVKDSKYCDNKELHIIPDATHCDMYDNVEKIPFDRMETFFEKYL